jgi:hypothetical protein
MRMRAQKAGRMLKRVKSNSKRQRGRQTGSR